MAKPKHPAGELHAHEACRLLQPIFPHRVVSAALLKDWSKRGVGPSGKRKFRGRNCYTFQDVVTLAAALELKDLGIQPLGFPELLETIRGGADRVVGGHNGEATVLFDVGPLRSKILRGWDEAVRRSASMR